MSVSISRRTAMAAGVAVGAMALNSGAQEAKGSSAEPFVYCLNTATIMGQKLTLPQQMDVAAKAGYTAVEPWVRDMEALIKAGGKLSDVKKQLSDAGITVESTIAFPQWIVDDEAARAKGMEQAKKDMDLSLQIGAKRIAAPPSGATNRTDMQLPVIAERYRALCELGEQMGITPMVELWGHSKTLTRLSEAAYVALEARHPRASILADIFHLYKGGSDPTGIRMMSPAAIPVIHFNDYPGGIAPAQIKDADRNFPGEGVAPITQILKDLKALGGKTVLSIEIFNQQYWKLDALVCAKTGFEKAKAAVAKAMA